MNLRPWRGLVSAVAAVLQSGVVPSLAAQPVDPQVLLTVGTAAAHRGETAYGEIRVPAGTDGGLAISVAVVHGAHPGPVVALLAGSHGTEYASIVALTRLIRRLPPGALAGSVIVVPLTNPASFEQMTVHVNPVDGKSLFGPDPDSAGTQTPRLLATLAELVVKPADVVVDLHGGDLDEDARPFSLWLRGGEAAQDSASLRLVLAFGLDHVMVRDVDKGDAKSRLGLPDLALGLGKTVLLAAAGRSGLVLPEDLTLLEDGLLGVLASLRMIEGTAHPVEHPVFMDRGKRALADGSGMFYSTVARGDEVAEGERVGYTTDYLGRGTGDVRAPASGIVTLVRGVPSVWKGATLVAVSSVMAKAPPYVKPAR